MSKLKELIVGLVKKKRDQEKDDGYEAIEAGIGRHLRSNDGYEAIEAGIGRRDKEDIQEDKIPRKTPKPPKSFDPETTPHRYAGKFKKPIESAAKLESNHKWQSKDQFKAIQHYTNYGYKSINRALYDKKKMTLTDSRHEKNLSAAIKGHTLHKDMVVYSGIKKDPAEITRVDSKTKERKAKVPAYMSTSLYHGTAEDFARRHEEVDSQGVKHNHTHVLRIHVPQGSHAHYVDHLSANSGEHEMILHKGSKLHIHPREHVKVEPATWNTNLVFHKHYHDAYLVHDGVSPTRHANGFVKSVKTTPKV